MSLRETPLTRRYWRAIGGTLVEEFSAVRRTKEQGRRLIDGIVILNGEHRIARANEVDIQGEDVVVIQTKANRVGMYLLGQALFSRHLVERLGARSVRSVAVCTRNDAVLAPLAAAYDIEIVVYGDAGEEGAAAE